jgi:5-carboxymethyl-2-hydroxymuconate isomerase
MPHIVIEYSANLDGALDMQRLVNAMHETALKTGVFPPGGARTRAARREHYRVADGRPEAAFIHVMARVGAGRDEATRKAAGQALFDTLTAETKAVFEARPLALSFELAEIPDAFKWKKNNIHDYLKHEAAE